jgi:uncharacterized protein YecE (DUF72 family)
LKYWTDFSALRLTYEKALERYIPYDRVIAAQSRMTQDITALVQQVVAQGKSAYVLVNNRVEGCSPLTIQALVAGLKRSRPSLYGPSGAW